MPDASPTTTATPRRGFGPRLALTAGVLVALLVAGEVVTRLFFPETHDPDAITAAMREVGLGKHRRLSDDLGIYFESKPDLDVTFGGHPVHTDAAGRRIADAPWPGDADVTGEPFRLHVIGDSTSFGWKVPFDESYPELVRRHLQRDSRRPVELVNHSVPGFNTEQQEALVAARVLPMSPDLVVWHYDHNDAASVLSASNRLGLPPRFGDNALGSALVKAVLRALESRRLAPRLFETTPHERYMTHIVSGPLYDRHLDALERSLTRLTEAGVPVLVVIFDANALAPDREDDHWDVLHPPVIERIERCGVPYVDLYPLMREEAGRLGVRDLQHQWWLDPASDPHPNRAGHAFIARHVTRYALTLRLHR